MAETKTPKGSYVKFGFSVFLLILCEAFIVFFLAKITVIGDPNKVGNPNNLVTGAALAAWSAVRYWKRIAQAEPEAVPIFRRKHRSILIPIAVFTGVVLVFAGAVGVRAGRRAAHNNRLSTIINQINQLGRKSLPFKSSFKSNVQREAGTFPEYIQRCADLEASLNNYEPALGQIWSLMKQMQEETNGWEDKDRRWQDVLLTYATLQSTLEKDIEYARLTRKEVSLSKQLSGRSQVEQMHFYVSQIKPLQAAERKTADEERAIVKSAHERGVKLPAEIYRQYGLE